MPELPSEPRAPSSRQRPQRGPDDAPLAQGRILGDRYQIRELLGRGGMGEVFRAFDLKLRVDVALKAVRPGRADGERGARAAAPGSPRRPGSRLAERLPRSSTWSIRTARNCVSMEYVDGVTLAEMLRDARPARSAGGARDRLAVPGGLEAIHAAGLVHRDIKPENVMITRAGRVVVMDFGIARARGRRCAADDLGHARLHGAGTGARRGGGRPRRCVLRRRRPGRDDCGRRARPAAAREAVWRAVREHAATRA